MLTAAERMPRLKPMYSAVQDRLREIATLRALGFSPGVLNGVAFSSANITIDLHMNTALALIGVAYACLIGLISGSFAAVQGARAPILTALRAI
jgi:ABC-type antimicrobial peptide transport system permease subunit